MIFFHFIQSNAFLRPFKNGYAPKCKVDFSIHHIVKTVNFFRYCGKLFSLPNLKEIFHIGDEGRNLTPRTLYGAFLMVHSKYVVET